VTPCPKPVKREPKVRKPLRRKHWMRKKAPRRLSRAGSDRVFLAWLHTQPCVVFRAYPLHICRGGIQASHLRHHTGLGLKEPDRNAIPMCRDVHEQWEQHRGIFKGCSKLTRFAMFMHWIAETRARYAGTPEVTRGREPT
jgi:hypothetical protein